MCDCAIINCNPANAGDKCYKWCCGTKQSVVAAVYNSVGSGGGGGTSLEALLELVDRIDLAVLDDGIDVEAIFDVSRAFHSYGIEQASLTVTEWLVGDILPQLSVEQANAFLVPALELQSSVYDAMSLSGRALQARGMATIFSRNMDAMSPRTDGMA